MSVRVEGSAATLLETTVDTTPHAVDGRDGTGSHPCQGPIGEAAGPTVTGALDDATRAAGLSWRGQWSSSSGDFLVTEVAGEAATSSGPWTILLNGVPTPVGGCSMKVAEGDRVLFARDVVFQTMTLGLSGPAEVDPGEQFSLLVEDERGGGAPISAAEVRSGELVRSTGSDGRAFFAIEEPGRYRFKATHPDGIRSNSFTVCVGVTGCLDTSGPAVAIRDLPDGTRFMRGATPRSLRGTVRGNETLSLAVKLRGHGGRCRAWNASRGRLVPRNCRAKHHWFNLEPSRGNWNLSTGLLPPGRYRVLVRPAGSNGKPWRSGVNRVDFTVLSKRLQRRVLLRRALRFMDRQSRSRTVRSSGLLAGWAGLALGVRGRKSAQPLVRRLKIKRPARATAGELARNLAATIRIRNGQTVPTMRKQLVARQDENGSFAGDVNLTAMAVLALPGTDAATHAASWLASIQQSGGGFSSGTGSPDVDTTGLAAWALAVQGHSEAVDRAASFIRSVQNPDGGFPALAGAASNAQSTGLGLLATRLAGGNGLGPKTADGITPTHYLATLQHLSGSIDYMPGLRTTPVWVTSQALLGLTSRQRLLSGVR